MGLADLPTDPQQSAAARPPHLTSPEGEEWVCACPPPVRQGRPLEPAIHKRGRSSLAWTAESMDPRDKSPGMTSLEGRIWLIVLAVARRFQDFASPNLFRGRGTSSPLPAGERSGEGSFGLADAQIDLQQSAAARPPHLTSPEGEEWVCACPPLVRHGRPLEPAIHKRGRSGVRLTSASGGGPGF